MSKKTKDRKRFFDLFFNVPVVVDKFINIRYIKFTLNTCYGVLLNKNNNNNIKSSNISKVFNEIKNASTGWTTVR